MMPATVPVDGNVCLASDDAIGSSEARSGNQTNALKDKRIGRTVVSWSK